MKRFSFLNKKYEANEFIVMLYRFAIVMALYSIGRIIFYLFNTSMFPNVDFSSFMRVMRGGVMFDTSAILYLNAIYFLLYLLPFPFKFKPWYQRMLKWIFMAFNGIGLTFNHIDIVYYRYILKRTTASVFDIVSHDAGNFRLIMRFFYDFWYIPVILVITLITLSKLYSLFKPRPSFNERSWKYAVLSVFALIIFSALSVIGMRGDRKSVV